MAGCGSCGGGARKSFRAAGDADQALAAGALTQHEVLDSRGNPTRRVFDSLVAATMYANSIGGSTRPV